MSGVTELLLLVVENKSRAESIKGNRGKFLSKVSQFPREWEAPCPVSTGSALSFGASEMSLSRGKAWEESWREGCASQETTALCLF